SPSWCQHSKARKKTLARGAREFNAKPRRGLQVLQAEGELQTPLTAAGVAAFLRNAPGLDKAAVGRFLGEAGAAPPMG
ncbi:unnamed protein product, partial [Discosporangium mesarthrocarpum]